MDGGGETVCGGVAKTDGILLVLKFGNRADGAENFFLHDLHVFADIGEDSGLDKVAFLAVTLTAGFDLCALFLPNIDVSKEQLASVIPKLSPSYEHTP